MRRFARLRMTSIHGAAAMVLLMLTDASWTAEPEGVLVLKSKDGCLEWRLTEDWESKPAQFASEIQAQRKGKRIYARVGYDKKGEPPMGRLEYAEKLRDLLLGQLKDSRAIALRELKGRGKDAVVFGVVGILNQTPVAYSVLVIEEKDVFVKAIVWGPASVVKDEKGDLAIALSNVAYVASESDMVLRSTDGTLELHLPAGWTQKESKNAKEIVAQNVAKRITVTASRDSKEMFPAGFEAYCDHVRKELLAKLKDSECSEPKKGTLGEREVVAYAVTGRSDAGEEMYFLTLTQGREDFIKTLVGTSASSAAEHSGEIDKIIQGVREVNSTSERAVKRPSDAQ